MSVINRLPTGGGGSSAPTMNVFAQTSQPTTYEGIWLNTSSTIDSVKTDNGVYLPNAWITNPTDLPSDIPYDFYLGSAVAVGTNIYLFGSYGTGTYSYAYKLNTLTGVYTALTNIPFDFYYGSAVAIGTDVYLFGGNICDKTAKKYNTLNNTYSALANIPYNFYSGSAVAVGTDVYLFGSYDSSYYRYAYKYNTLNNTYSALANIPYNFYYGSAVAIGTDVYLFGGSVEKTTAKKYNTLNNTYSALANIPYNFHGGSAVNISSKIYLLGGYGGAVQYKDVQVFSLTAKKYTENQLVITRSSENTGAYTAQLFPTPSNVSSNYFGRFLTGFNSVYLYKNSTLNQYATYYGTGSAWTQFITI